MKFFPRKKFEILLLICVAFLAYIIGAATAYKHLPPYNKFLTIKHYIFGGSKYPTNSSEYIVNLINDIRRSEFMELNTTSDVVMIGDSITASALWNEFFQNLKIANRGIYGDKTVDILDRIDTVISTHPKKAFLMMGINDIFNNTPVSEIYENYIKITKILIANNATVIIQSTLECNKKECGAKLDQVRQLNKMLEDYARKNEILYVNINKGLSSDSDGLLPQFTPDGVHLNGSGYIIWSRAIREVLIYS